MYIASVFNFACDTPCHPSISEFAIICLLPVAFKIAVISPVYVIVIRITSVWCVVKQSV
jgi:hypothetical protein